jgi:hypothetical protein
VKFKKKLKKYLPYSPLGLIFRRKLVTIQASNVLREKPKKKRTAIKQMVDIRW